MKPSLDPPILLKLFKRELNGSRIRIPTLKFGYLCRCYQDDPDFEAYKNILKDLNDIGEKGLDVPNDNKYEIHDCGGMGISVTKDGDLYTYDFFRHFTLSHLWNFPVDIKNWQKEPLPSPLLEYGVDPKIILGLILEKLYPTRIYNVINDQLERF